MKEIWKKYLEKLMNAENECDGEVGCTEVMAPSFLNKSSY